jgi:ankyrin repeat protein
LNITGREIELYERLFIGTANRFPAILAWWPRGATAIQIVGCFKQVTMFARRIWPANGGHSLKRMHKAKSNLADCPRAGIAAYFIPMALTFACVHGAAAIDARAGSSTQSKALVAGAPDGGQLSTADRDILELSLDQAMWTALAFENAAKLREVLKRGADPNKPEKLSQMTPLMVAETAELVEILLKAGADPNQKDRTGRTALHHAVKMREAGSIVRLLGQAGADVNARAQDIGECTPLLSAVEHYFEDKAQEETALAIRILIHLGADINATATAGHNALSLAASHNQPELIRLLIELGADPERRLVNGRTPLDYAREAKAEDAIQALAAAPSKQPPAN